MPLAGKITRFIWSRLLIIAGVCVGLSLCASAAEKPRVLHSLKPLQLISNGLAPEQLDNRLLLLSHQDAHSYSLRFSDMRKLRQADLFIWLGPDFEHYLSKPLRSQQPAVLEFAYLQRASQLLPDTKADEQTHIWLNPGIIAKLVPLLAAAISQIAPEERVALSERARGFAAELEALDMALARQLHAYRGLGVISDHKGLEVFLRHYGLRHSGSLETANHGSVSLKKAVSLNRELELGNARCIALTDPHNMADAQQIFAGHRKRIVVTDLFGRHAQSYTELMTQLAKQLSGCLQD